MQHLLTLMSFCDLQPSNKCYLVSDGQDAMMAGLKGISKEYRLGVLTLIKRNLGSVRANRSMSEGYQLSCVRPTPPRGCLTVPS